MSTVRELCNALQVPTTLPIRQVLNSTRFRTFSSSCRNDLDIHTTTLSTDEQGNIPIYWATWNVCRHHEHWTDWLHERYPDDNPEVRQGIAVSSRMTYEPDHEYVDISWSRHNIDFLPPQVSFLLFSSTMTNQYSQAHLPLIRPKHRQLCLLRLS